MLYMSGKTLISLSIDTPSLEYIDAVANKHRMSRTGFMVFASIKYAKDFEKEEKEKVNLNGINE